MGMQKMGSDDYVIRVCDQPAQVDAAAWDALLARQTHPTPFMRHACLAALHNSGSATPASGWTLRWITLWRGGQLAAACPLYVKDHSYGEYVFDWAWAEAYARHGLDYYPKGVVAVPFTPVPGSRLLADSPQARAALLQALLAEGQRLKLSSLHLLFAADDDLAACETAGLMRRDTVQFHWFNAHWPDFDAFLASLTQDKRKKIRQERRKVADAGVTFRWARGTDIHPADWDFFYRCYERTYREHGNPPYLTPDFFARMARELPQAWLLFVAERDGQPIASSLIAIQDHLTLGNGQNDSKTVPDHPPAVAYGRYWGALERVDCLHFEACYYQPIDWCIAHGVARFEGGAQGEHKMARALLPVQASSAHWLAHPGFADAVDRFLDRERDGVRHYLDELATRSPLRRPG
jgi:predicted N-acyltransferase